MKQTQTDILIIGAGLTGLTLAYNLRKTTLSVHLLEARNRLGGRIETLKNEGTAPQEMGATWLGKKHTALVALLNDLQLDTFEQILGNRAIYEPISTSPPQLVQLPPNNDPSFRIKGGSAAVIEALAKYLQPAQISTNQQVISIEKQGDKLLVKTQDRAYLAHKVVSTLPPYLFAKTIHLQQPLPEKTQVILSQTHTWMGESIKVALTYKTPFWREKNTSGTIFSNVGPIPEMYDHSNVEDDKYALKGFLNGVYFSVTKAERLAMVLKQLRKYFGAKADNFLTYEEKVWRNEPFTFTPYAAHILPHQNNGHPLFREAYWEGKLFLAGAETAEAFPGYMDGAVRSANFVAQQLIASIRKE